MDRLEELIKSKGVKKKYIAECLGITPKALTYKLQGKTEFRLNEVADIAHILGLTKKEAIDIFLPSL